MSLLTIYGIEGKVVTRCEIKVRRKEAIRRAITRAAYEAGYRSFRNEYRVVLKGNCSVNLIRSREDGTLRMIAVIERG